MGAERGLAAEKNPVLGRDSDLASALAVAAAAPDRGQRGPGFGVHGFILGRAIGQRPSLYAETLYDRGGVFRWLMLALTHGRGQWLLSTLAAVAALFLTLGPLLSPRGRNALRALWEKARWLVVIAGVLGLGAGLVALWPTPSASPATPSGSAAAGSRPPSLLLIAVDSLRADRVFDSERARRVVPNIWRLAERSVRFESAHVTVPRTFPSLVTLLTGRYPYRHGIRTMFPSLQERERVPPALPAMLREHGYSTSVVSDFCGEVFSRIDLGFDLVQVPAFDAKAIVLQRSLTVHKNFLPYVTGAVGGSAGLEVGQRLFPELQSARRAVGSAASGNPRAGRSAGAKSPAAGRAVLHDRVFLDRALPLRSASTVLPAVYRPGVSRTVPLPQAAASRRDHARRRRAGARPVRRRDGG